MSETSLLPVILCGGTGSRLWPLSRKSLPKQFLSLNSESDYSLLQQTQIRIKNFNSNKSVLYKDFEGKNRVIKIY